MRNISPEELKRILENHELWLNREGGECADLSSVDLRDHILVYANLSYANLKGADLRYINLNDTNLRHTNLIDADLRYANLEEANLKYADLRNANLGGADLRYADLKEANLKYADLRRADLSYANLKSADLRGANLKESDLSNANLAYTDLSDTNLSYASLVNANLTNADSNNAKLNHANLKHAVLRGANLRGADLSDVITNIYTIGYNLACPEKGSFIGYKKADNCIVELLILEDSKRSSATSVKCRCDKAKVLHIINIETDSYIEEVRSDYDENFVYRVGEIVSVNDYDNDRWNECSTGIHFFVSKQDAINYK